MVHNNITYKVKISNYTACNVKIIKTLRGSSQKVKSCFSTFLVLYSLPCVSMDKGRLQGITQGLTFVNIISY